MDEVVLTFHCAVTDVEAVIQCLRAETDAPLHVRNETVHGRDFSDAMVSEQVTGTLHRAAVEVLVARTRVDALVAIVAAARRAHPVRWRATPVIARGRLS
jgi:hypothetical protein